MRSRIITALAVTLALMTGVLTPAQAGDLRVALSGSPTAMDPSGNPASASSFRAASGSNCGTGSAMASYAPRGAKGEFSFGLIGFAAQTGEPSAFLRAIIACQDPKIGGGLYNWSHYCDRQVDADLTRALGTVDDTARLALLQRATHLAMTTEAILPLHFQASTWAARAGIAIEPRTDERTLAASFRPLP
jgi:ABC-type transport system substrate-binding protein